MAVLACFDIDGTVETAGGPVRFADIQRLIDRGNGWAVLSSRCEQRSREALVIPCEEVDVCRVDMRAEELVELMKVLKDKYPDKYDKYIYVADRQIDQAEALRAGWYFCYAKNFARFVELL